MTSWGWGSDCSDPLANNNASSISERVCSRCVPVIFSLSTRYLPVLKIPGFYTTRNMPSLAFGIHNEQYDYNMGVIIYGL